MPATLQPTGQVADAPARDATTLRECRATRILLVEDEPLTAEVFERALDRSGYAVEVARDGLLALHRLAEHPPDLLILDMSLPGASGRDILQRLRSAGHERLPVIVVSGSGRQASAVPAATLWPGTWLEKPIKPRHLLEVVRDFLRPTP